jgi:hypothetical protein
MAGVDPMTKYKVFMTLALLLIALYLSPYYILGEDMRVRIHDNLDSNVVWYKLMADTHTLFGGLHSVIPNIMNGLPRNALGSEFDIGVLLYAIFPPFTAYTINQTIMRYVAFFGMYLLIKKHLFKTENHELLTIGISLCYAFLPFWPSGGLSIAGLPLALYAFLNIKERNQTGWDWAIVCLIPFYSSFILSFSFFIGGMGLWWLNDLFSKRKINIKWLLALSLMTIIYLAHNYRVIYEMFIQNGFNSHREEFSRGNLDTKEMFLRALHYFIFGQTHVIRMTQYIVLPVTLFALITSIIYRKKVGLLWTLFILNVLFSIIIAAYYWEGTWSLENYFPIIGSFNFGRAHFLEPLTWYLGFALSLFVILKTFHKGKLVVSVLLSAQILLLFSLNEQYKYTFFNYPSFRQFYSTELFDDIKDYIGKPPSSYRVVSIGIHPAIAQYNGFYTLDGYVPSYPLHYKHQFRKIIAPELKKNGNMRWYYDSWGSRCYIFVNELGKHYRYTKEKHKTIHHLKLNTKVLRKMGGEYVLSAVRIANNKENDLVLERKFSRTSSPWAIYLYRVK